MKLPIIFLGMLFMQSCQITNLGKKDKHSLYINTVIPAHSSLEISTADTKSFSFDALIKSNEDIEILADNNKIKMGKKHKYSMNMGDNTSVKFMNSSDLNGLINIRIYNHSSKVIKKTAEL